MNTLLHIKASPMGERSSSSQAAEAFLAGYQEAHPEATVETLDLWSFTLPDFDQVAASGKYKVMGGMPHSQEEAVAWQRVVETIDHFKSADAILISAPMWNFGIPYRLKQYIDILVQPGLTFSYDPQHGYSGLVTGRPVQLILSRAGEYPEGTEAATIDHQKSYLELIAGFMGFTDVRVLTIEPTMAAGPEIAREKVNAAITAAREEGRDFASQGLREAA